jgi:hypothetical protein
VLSVKGVEVKEGEGEGDDNDNGVIMLLSSSRHGTHSSCIIHSSMALFIAVTACGWMWWMWLSLSHCHGAM